MEPILSKKVKGGTERVVLQNAFLNLTVTFKRETVAGEGTEKEAASTIDYPTDQVQVQFDADTIASLISVNLQGMLDNAIYRTKAKYK